VRHLNADSSFLLTFSPFENPSSSDLTSANGAYTVLIDPFITGSSIVLAPWFAKTVHTEVPAISHMSEIEEPDVVICSQNKPDHTHKETLLQLDPAGKTVFACEPGAAKAIKSWDYFDPNRIFGLEKYTPKAKFGNCLRLRVPPLAHGGHAGEVNISFIPAKNYMTGLHNGFGITYQPPTSTKTLASISTMDLPHKPRLFHMPLSPATLPPTSPSPPGSPMVIRPGSSYNTHGRNGYWSDSQASSFSARVGNYSDSQASSYQSSAMSDHVPLGPYRHATDQPPTADYQPPGLYRHRPHLSRSSNTASSEFLPATISSSTPDNSSQDHLAVPFTLETDPNNFHFNDSILTPPDSVQASRHTSFTQKPVDPTHTALSPDPANTTRQQTLAPLPTQTFTQHQSISSLSSHQTAASQITPGRPKTLSILYSPHGLPLADLQPYISNHLLHTSALPLTLLLHSFDHVQNPWYLGGNIMTGLRGGMQIARALMARVWLSAHDEDKDDRGLSVKQLKVRKASVEEVRRQLARGEKGAWNCDVRNLRNGAEMFIGPSRDLLSGMEGSRETRPLRFSPAIGT
jgi:hypothetical protein